MKKNQTSLRKTASKIGIPNEPSNKAQSKKKLSRLAANIRQDINEQDHIILDTFEVASQQQKIPKAKFHLQDDHTECYKTESEDIPMEYDAEIMEEIEKEIYEAQNYREVSPIQKLRALEAECTNDEEIPQKLKKKEIGISFIQSKQRNNGMENKNNSTKILENKRNLNISTQTQKIQSQSEESIIVPQKSSQKVIHSQSQSLTKKTDHAQKMGPKKQLKSCQMPNKKFINFSIDLRLLKGNLQMKRIIKCMESNQIDGKWTAKFLIETQKGEQVIVDNEEMIWFYKDFLIDYYQEIHFS